MPHEGMPVGRRIIFANSDVEAIDRLPGVDKITGRFFIGGSRQSNSVQSRVGDKVASYDVRSVHPDHLYLENTIMVAGRFLNDVDIEDKRKVCVIGEPVAKFLFGTTDDVIGRWIEINRIPFQVVGLFTDEGGEGEREKIYIPITTSQTAFNGADRVHMMMFTMRPDVTVAESKRMADAAVAALAAAHHFSPEDTQAVRVRNNVEQFENFLQIFVGIRVFVVVMGICTLVAGVIGVSNIMMIVVRERTSEIGVRKALGATPSDIVTSIVQESVFITAVAGYLGLVAGVGVLALIDSLIPPTDLFAHPEVDLKRRARRDAVARGRRRARRLVPGARRRPRQPDRGAEGRMIGVLDLDNWHEITATLRKNKLRTVLTALGVFLGILILLLMIGFGRSLENGVQRRMAGFATNAVFVWGQRTTKPYAGLPAGPADRVRQPRHRGAGAGCRASLHLAPRNQLGGFAQGSNVRYGTKTGAFQVSGDYPAFQYVQTPVMRAGRFLNERDIDERRKVAVIGEGVVEQLYARHRADRHVHRDQRRLLPGRRRVRDQADRRSRPIASSTRSTSRSRRSSRRSTSATGSAGSRSSDSPASTARSSRSGSASCAQAAPQDRARRRQRDRRVEHVQGVREDEHAVLPDQPGDVGRQARCACSPARSACRTSC